MKRLTAAAVVLVVASAVFGQSFGDGTHLVGVDIQAGTYRAPGGDWCTWERLSGLSGEFEDLIAVEVPTGRTIVEVKATDKAFKTSGCGAWTLVDGAPGPTKAELQLSYMAFVSALVRVVEPPLAEDIFDAMDTYLQGNPWGMPDRALQFTLATIDNARKAAEGS